MLGRRAPWRSTSRSCTRGQEASKRLGSRSRALWHRLLGAPGAPASESGRLRHTDGAAERGDRRRRGLELATLHAHQLEAYLGLVPREYRSGETQRRGPITKAGHSRVRWLLVQAAISMLRRPCWA